jgi:hypothetical protein
MVTRHITFFNIKLNTCNSGQGLNVDSTSGKKDNYKRLVGSITLVYLQEINMHGVYNIEPMNYV